LRGMIKYKILLQRKLSIIDHLIEFLTGFINLNKFIDTFLFLDEIISMSLLVITVESIK